MISKSEFREWRDHPVTEVFYKYLDECREEFTSRLVHNNGAADFDDEFLRGSIQVLEQLNTIDEEVLNDGA